MADHILLSYASRRPFRETPSMPDHAEYNSAKGYWTVDGSPLTNTVEFKGGGRVSKKCDQETGEDQKGE